MQGLADGYFVLPFTVGNYLGTIRKTEPLEESDPVCQEALKSVQARVEKLMNAPDPTHAPEYFHRKLGNIIWKYCGMSRDAEGLKKALEEIRPLREEFHEKVKVLPQKGETFNQALERAGRVADFFELGELMCIDALERDESCGGHFRTEHTIDGEAKRDDEHFQHVAAWEWTGDPSNPALHKEELTFEYVKPTMRSYK